MLLASHIPLGQDRLASVLSRAANRRLNSEQMKISCHCLLLALAIACSAASRSLAAPPNIVIILADDMGWGDPKCNNPESRIATQNIDRLAAQGMRFTDAHSPASWCTPTRYGLLTGCYPFRQQLDWRQRAVIDDGRLTLPGMLRERGYRTAMVGKWHLGFNIEQRDRSKPHHGGPVDRGFDSYFGIPTSLDIPPYYFIEGRDPRAAPTETIEAKNTSGWTRIQGEFWRAGGIAPGFKHIDVLPVLTDRAEKEILNHHFEHGSEPFFMYFALPAPHTPWVPTRAFAGKSKVPLYGDFVRQVDAVVGRIMAALDETGMTENTLLVFTSDNGPVWYQADEEEYDHKSTAHFRGMKGDCWEGGHRMPFLVRWPERVPAGTHSDQLVCLTDIFATCAAIVGYELPNDAAEDSIDFSKVLMGESETSVRDTLVVNSTGDFFMARRQNLKLIPFRGSGGFSEPKHVKDVPRDQPQGQLYDLTSDPTETNNLYTARPEDVKELAELLENTRTSGRTRPGGM